MKQLFPHISFHSLRVFNACVLSFSMLAAPIAPLAASTNGTLPVQTSNGASPVRTSATGKHQSQLTPREKLGAGLAVNPLSPLPLPPVGPTITATLDDNFPLASKKNPGVDTINYTAVITNTAGTDASGIAYTDTLDNNTTQTGMVRVSPVTVDDSYTCTGNVSISPLAASGVLANDYLGQNPAGTITSYGVNGNEQMTIGNSTPTAQAGGSVSVNVDGSFTYNPPANFTGADTFHYTLSNVTGNSIGLVTITVSDRILFVAASGVGAANCKPATPCTLATADALAAPTGKDLVFVESGTYSSAAISLNASQKIAGQAISIQTALTDAGITLAPNSQPLTFPMSTTPVLNNAATIVTLNTNNLVEDLSINPSAGSGILSNAIASGTGTIRDLTVTATGAANAVNLTSNTGATFNFSNIGITAASGTGFNATGGGTVNATQNNTTTVNTITTTTGIALNVANTTIGASGVTFRSISASGASSGIVLNNTGTSGGLVVTGNGSTCTFATQTCDGGSIQNSTGVGVSLTSTKNVSLTRMKIQNSGTDGINANAVNGFTLDTSIVTDTTGVSGDEGIQLDNVSGTITVSNSEINKAPHNGIQLINTNTNLAAFNVTNTRIINQVAGVGNDGILFVAAGTTVVTAATVSGCTFQNILATALQPQTQDTANIQSFVVTGNTFTTNNVGIDADVSQSSDMTITIGGPNVSDSNTFTFSGLEAINLDTATTTTTSASLTGKIQKNHIGTQGTKDSGSQGDGIRVAIQGNSRGVVRVDQNDLHEIPNGRPILAFVRNPVSGAALGASLEYTNNTIPRPTGTNFDVGCGGGATPCPGNTMDIEALNGNKGCAVISGNTVYDPESWPQGAGNSAILLFQSASTMNLEGTNANANTQLANTNTVTNSTAGANDFETFGSVTVVAAGTCGSFPALPNPGDGARYSPARFDAPTNGGSNVSPLTLASLNQALHPVAPFASNLNFLGSSEATTMSASPSGPAVKSRPPNAPKSRRPDTPTAPLSGETISFNLPVVLNVGKSVTIKYDATVNTPPGAAFVQTQGNVTFTGGPGGGINTTDPETGTQVPTKTNINTVITWIGVTSTDWNTASNWDFNYVPVSVSDVKVPNPAQPFQPTLSSSSPTINSLNLSNTRVLTISGQTLTITGSTGSDLTLDGTISGGGLSFGTGTHAINNSGGTGSITPTNTTTVLSGANVTLNNTLQMDALAVNSGGSFNATNRMLSLTGDLTNNGTFTTTGSTVILNGSSAQAVSGATTFNDLTVNNSNGVTLSSSDTVGGTLTLTSGVLGVGTTTLTLNGPVSVSSGSINSSATGTVNYNKSTNVQNVAPGNYGNLTFSNFTKTLPSSTVKIAGTFTTGAAGSHTVTGSTVEYNGGSAQTMPTGFTTYNNLTLNNTMGVTGFAALTVQGLLEVKAGTFTSSTTINNVQIDSGATLAGVTATTMNVSGNWTNNSTFTPNGNTVNFNGSAAQTIGGTSVTPFFNLTINNSNVLGVTLNTDETVNGALTLTLGNITTGANTLAIGPSGTTSHTSGHVIGNLKKTFAANGSFIFPVGTANGYSPVDTNVTAGTGDLTIVATETKQPSLATSTSLKRYWTLTESGNLTTDLVFHYLAGDVMGTEANYRIIRVSGGTAVSFPNSCPSPCVDTVNHKGTINGVSTFSDWTLGEPAAPTAVCTFDLSPASIAVPAAGTSGNFLVQVQNECSWTASSTAAWIKVPAGTSGQGAGGVSYTVEANLGTVARTGTIVVGDKSFTVTQATDCPITLSATSESFAAIGGAGSFTVSGRQGCAWTATTTDYFIHIMGTGNGTVSYTVDTNTAYVRRIGTITVAGQSFTVLQGAYFIDVPLSYPQYTEIGKLSARGITNGCGYGYYCPESSVTREQMAIFIERGLGQFNPPYPATQRFLDVGPERGSYAFIDDFAKRGITLGCGGGNYCPDQEVARGPMAAFMVRAKGIFNPDYNVPQRFFDVPPSNSFYGFIEQMWVLGITKGCGGGNYCPDALVKRGEMAAFLVRAFGL